MRQGLGRSVEFFAQNNGGCATARPYHLYASILSKFCSSCWPRRYIALSWRYWTFEAGRAKPHARRDRASRGAMPWKSLPLRVVNQDCLAALALRSSPMAATVYACPGKRIVRRTTPARMTEGDLRTLRQHWPFGWHEPMTSHDGITFDRWLVPFDCAIDLPPARTITL